MFLQESQFFGFAHRWCRRWCRRRRGGACRRVAGVERIVARCRLTNRRSITCEIHGQNHDEAAVCHVKLLNFRRNPSKPPPPPLSSNPGKVSRRTGPCPDIHMSDIRWDMWIHMSNIRSISTCRSARRENYTNPWGKEVMNVRRGDCVDSHLLRM